MAAVVQRATRGRVSVGALVIVHGAQLPRWSVLTVSGVSLVRARRARSLIRSSSPVLGLGRAGNGAHLSGVRGRESVELAGSIGANLRNLGALALHLRLGPGGSPVSLGHLRSGLGLNLLRSGRGGVDLGPGLAHLLGSIGGGLLDALGGALVLGGNLLGHPLQLALLLLALGL